MKIRYDYLAIGWSIVVLILCGIPGRKIPQLTFLEWLRPDKIVHLILFGTQSFLLLKAYFEVGKSAAEKKWLYVGLSIAYGIVIEILQKYIFIDRSADYRDAIANAIGAFCGLWIFNFLSNRRLKSE